MSGLLTSLRYALDLGVRLGGVELPVITDLGYSWRFDKGFSPDGRGEPYPDWMTAACMELPGDPEQWGRDLLAVRDQVAALDELGSQERKMLREEIDRLAAPYEQHFRVMLADVDVVIAMNMTLTDAVPVTLALLRVLDEMFADGQRLGRVVWWDHDLLKNYARTADGKRVYPVFPNELTPLPGANSYTHWATLTPAQVIEAAGYPTDAVPILLPPMVPLSIPDGELRADQLEFLAEHGIKEDQPVLVVPKRVVPEKGVALALRLHAATIAEARRRGDPIPVLVVFGSLAEEREHAQDMLDLADSLGLDDLVVWADGVPLSTYRDALGLHLDEIDLLHIARRRWGAVVYTPDVPGVEAASMPPAFAAVAGMPCAVSPFKIFESVYPGYSAVMVGSSDSELKQAAGELLDMLAAVRDADPVILRKLAENRDIALRTFGEDHWRTFWQELAAAFH
ncbi:hypothetical protein AB0C52_10315 [Streptomyces sp. NPDC048717]|uniref:hypothetical protein n=1 Tax=Streptomyces sp. NPDC048717 TaxID=3154928 RepID=UPI0034338E7D